MEFLFLGPLAVRHAGTTIDLGGHRRRAVLAALLLRANTSAGFGYLADAAWDRPPAAPESNIRTHVAGLRRTLRECGDGDARLVTGQGAYRLAAEPAELDLLRFREFATRGDRFLRAGELATAMTDLGRALDLWRGEPLEGIGHPGAVLLAEAARLVDLRLTVAEQHAAAAIGLGRAESVVDGLGALLDKHPLHEPLWARFVQALHQCGRTAEALAAFARVRGTLIDELGVEPGALLRHTHQRVLTEAPVLVPGALGAWGQMPVDFAEVTGRRSRATAWRVSVP
ncbi:AfsR/SARP family transcriptional regulator [Actinokineospora enzanensis]|uniref:AfsR/SARP family transcriptional regulator n=1 Tax=Actinokineospora enzanensis TaxID=155975 RepID=UPI000378B6E4|nr:AfsR/SARP family transcriptional regulator [Actinokineospora enzanensis]